MSYYYDKLFEDSSQLINFFLQDNWFQITSVIDANRTGKGGMIFRGQSDAKWELIPSAFRSGSLNDFTPQPPEERVNLTRLRRYLGGHLHAEARAIQLFLMSADSMGIPTPIDYTVTKHGLDLILAALNDVEDFDYTVPFPHDSLQRAVSLAQHHGVPTRFLDWTESPLVACYFAAIGASCFSERSPAEDQEIAVIFMSSSSLSQDSSPVELVRAPRYENLHLHQQQGIFLTIRQANSFFLANGRWPALNDFSSSKIQLYRVRLPATRADELLRVLFNLGITRHSLMPTLGNAATANSYAKKLFGGSP